MPRTITLVVDPRRDADPVAMASYDRAVREQDDQALVEQIERLRDRALRDWYQRIVDAVRLAGGFGPEVRMIIGECQFRHDHPESYPMPDPDVQPLVRRAIAQVESLCALSDQLRRPAGAEMVLR